MTTLAAATDGLPIYDAAGQPLYRTPMDAVADAAGNLVDVNPAHGHPRDEEGKYIVQPPQMTRINTLTTTSCSPV
jgi:hypothetical protein